MTPGEICLSRLYSPGALLADRDGDGLPDAVRARLVIGGLARLPEHLAAADLAARLGFETLALALPLVIVDMAELPDDAIPVFIGRPTTLPEACPAPLRAALDALHQDARHQDISHEGALGPDATRPGEGLVAVIGGESPAVLVAGADEVALADAALLAAAYLPASRADSAGLPLAALCDRVGALCGAAPLVEALLTRAGRLAEARLRVHVAPAGREALRRALTEGLDPERLPCDLAITLDGGKDDRDPPIVLLAGPRRLISDLAPTPSGPESTPALSAGGSPPALSAGEPATPETASPSASLPPLRSLAGLYGPAGCAVDADGDLLPEVPRARLLLPDDLSAPEAAEAIHVAARLGLESLGLRLPHGAETPEPGGVAIVVERLAEQALALGGSMAPAQSAIGGEDGVQLEEVPGAEDGVRLVEAPDGSATILVSGRSRGRRAQALRALAELDASGPPGEHQRPLAEVQQDFQRLLALSDPEAWAGAAVAAARQLPESAVSPSPEPLSLSVELPGVPAALRAAAREQIVRLAASHAAGLPVEVEVSGAETGATVMDESHRLTWEVDELWQHISTEVVPALAALPPGDRDWLLDLRVSEPEGRRRQIKSEVLRQIRAAGLTVRREPVRREPAGDGQVRVLPADRQGRAWLLEEIAPRLQAHAAATVTIRVQRFARDYPCLELPIRWLQDLHPVDELLGERLGLPHDAIRFELAEIAHTYEVEARDAAGEIVLRAALDVTHGRRPYLAGFPEWGTVHPPTGCVRLLVAGQPVVDKPVPPDPERVWDLVQTALLPRLRAHILAATGGTPRVEDQPFFGELAVEAWLSEEDTALGLREERDSPLESLHEDLYFMLLDYCCAVTAAATSGGEPYRPPWVRPRAPGESMREPRLWMAPGRIVPYIHRGDGGAGRVRFTLAAAAMHAPRLAWRRGGAAGSIPLIGAPECTLRTVGLRWPDGSDGGDGDTSGCCVLLDLDGPDAACEQALALLAGWASVRAGDPAPGAAASAWTYTIRYGATELRGLPAPPARSGDVARGAMEPPPSEPARREPLPGMPVVPWDRVLGPDEVESAVRDLARLPGVRAYRAGRSARGRPSYAIEVTAPLAAGIRSRAKLSTWKCTLLLNARHHANEASSTSAVLRLAGLLSGDAEWRRFLDRVNVVIVPCENPDGAALHDALQQEHPAWMHHAGRYNDAGLEFASEYANPHTRHSEALVLPALWSAWAPDIVCDDHGFPSHEWVQPFAGHSNPWFQSHWIAQGLIYLILPRVTNPRYAGHARAADEVQRRMVRILSGDRAVRERNSSYADRYRTFLSDRLPEAFPAPFDQDVLVHRYDHDPDDRTRLRASLAGPAGAHPHVTTLSLVTEVADETAQGRYMALCAHTHLLANRALLEYLYDVDAMASVRRERYALPDGAVVLRAVRPRPVQAE